MIPTQIALQLAATRQREFESRAARRRLVQHLATTTCPTRRIDTVFPALRRMSGIALHRRPSVACSAIGPSNCCIA